MRAIAKQQQKENLALAKDISLVAKVGENAPADLVVIANADHSFENHLDELKRVIADWIKRQLAVT